MATGEEMKPSNSTKLERIMDIGEEFVDMCEEEITVKLKQ